MKRVGQIFRESVYRDLKKGFKENGSIFLLTYSKLTSTKIGDLRKNRKSAGAHVVVSKNRLAQIALKELGHNQLAERVGGQTAFIWSNKDSAEISKILIKFVKDIETVALKGGLLQGKIIEEGDIKRLSDLPSREVLLAQLLGTIIAPLTRLAYVLNAKTIDLLSIIKQLSEKKGGK